MRIRIIPLLLIANLLSLPLESLASLWATGYHGGNQACPYPQQEPPALSEAQIEIMHYEEELREKENLLDDITDEIDELESELEDLEEELGETLKAEHFGMILDHISSSASCGEYETGGPGIGSPTTHKGAAEENPDAFIGSSGPGSYPDDEYRLEVHGCTPEEWRRICDPRRSGGVIAHYACQRRFQVQGSSGARNCVRNLNKLVRIYETLRDRRDDIEDLEEGIERMERKLKRTRRRGNRVTEAGCEGCALLGRSSASTRKTDLIGVARDVGLGIAGMYLDYRKTDMLRKNNAAMGYATHNTPGMGPHYIAAGLSGLMAGGNGGGPGCASMIYPGAQNGQGMPNAFAYPNDMYGQQYGPTMPHMNALLQMQSIPPYSTGIPAPHGPMSMYGQNMGPANYQFNAHAGFNAGGPAIGTGGPLSSLYGLHAGGGPASLHAGMNMGAPAMSMGAPASILGNAGIGNPAMGPAQLRLQQEMMALQIQNYQRQQENAIAQQRTLMGLEQEIQTLVTRYKMAQYGLHTGQSPTPGGGFEISAGAQFNIGSGSIGGGSTFPSTPQVMPSTR